MTGARTERTAVVAIWREGRDDRVDITSVQRRQVTADDLRRTRIDRGKDGRPNVMSPVDGHLAAVGAKHDREIVRGLAHNGHRPVDVRTIVAVEMRHELQHSTATMTG